MRAVDLKRQRALVQRTHHTGPGTGHGRRETANPAKKFECLQLGHHIVK